MSDDWIAACMNYLATHPCAWPKGTFRDTCPFGKNMTDDIHELRADKHPPYRWRRYRRVDGGTIVEMSVDKLNWDEVSFVPEPPAAAETI